MRWPTRLLFYVPVSLGFLMGLAVRSPGSPDPAANGIERANRVLASPVTRAYHGCLHSHTSFSDGQGTPAEAFNYAQSVARLDYLAVTDHDWMLTYEEFYETQRESRAFTTDGVFVALYGAEWTHLAGHLIVLECPIIVHETTMDGFYTSVSRVGAIASFAHPGRYGSVLDDLQYHPVADDNLCLMEVRDAFEELQYFRALSNGWHVGADGSQDTWLSDWGVGNNSIGTHTWSGVWAPALTRPDLLDAIRHRRTFSTQDRDLELDFRIAGHEMGVRFETSATLLDFEAHVHDEETGDATSRIDLFCDGFPIDSNTPQTSSFVWRTQIPQPLGSREHFYIVRVQQADGDFAWSSPIWITVQVPTSTSPVWAAYP